MPKPASAIVGVLVAMLPLAACHDQANGAGGRDRITVVGSSTVYPFTTMVAERFANSQPGVKPPVIESTGTGAGAKQFCAGVGAAFPDILDASRRLKRSEYQDCASHGVTDIMEVQVGIDGIAFAQATAGPPLTLTAVDVYKALAADPNGQPNTAKTWKDVNPDLPAVPIQVYGPPATSGTRDAMAELILARGCEAIYPAVVAMKEHDPAGFAKACHTIRSDGPYVDAGENDNLIVQKLESNPDAVGIFGYSYLEGNAGRLRGIPLNGSAPTADTIGGGTYPGARPLFLYVKKAHLSAVHGLREFLDTYRSMWAAGGPLAQHGLIAAPPAVLAASATVIEKRRELDSKTLTD